jgi:hypothetical protein
LRRIYTDPITNRNDWVIITGQGGIIGVHSRSEKSSLKIWEGKQRYSEWTFVYNNASKGKLLGKEKWFSECSVNSLLQNLSV